MEYKSSAHSRFLIKGKSKAHLAMLRLTPDSVLRDYSYWGMMEHMGWPGWNWVNCIQGKYLLAVLSLWPLESSFILLLCKWTLLTNNKEKLFGLFLSIKILPRARLFFPGNYRVVVLDMICEILTPSQFCTNIKIYN